MATEPFWSAVQSAVDFGCINPTNHTPLTRSGRLGVARAAEAHRSSWSKTCRWEFDTTTSRCPLTKMRGEVGGVTRFYSPRVVNCAMLDD